jgi:nicotinamidase/pyrazinamidase
VLYSAQDGHAAGFSVSVVEDACRAIDMNGSAAAARISLAERSIPLVTTGELLTR